MWGGVLFVRPFTRLIFETTEWISINYYWKIRVKFVKLFHFYSYWANVMASLRENPIELDFLREDLLHENL
jgi:hypothetical protein